MKREKLLANAVKNRPNEAFIHTKQQMMKFRDVYALMLMNR